MRRAAIDELSKTGHALATHTLTGTMLMFPRSVYTLGDMLDWLQKVHDENLAHADRMQGMLACAHGQDVRAALTRLADEGLKTFPIQAMMQGDPVKPLPGSRRHQAKLKPIHTQKVVDYPAVCVFNPERIREEHMDVSQLMYRDGLMSDERILITGGGTGLGKEMAEGFLKLGAEVHICGRRGSVCEETAKELMDKHGGKVVPHACDIRVAEAIHDMNNRIWSEHGPLTGLVNNAAGNFISRTEDLSTRGFDAISNSVFRGSFYMTHDIGKRWIEEKRRGM